jgi:Domain of unknown function (DUF4833)
VKCLVPVALAVGACLACSPAIPPPVTASPSQADAQAAAENSDNADPNLDPPFGPFDLQTVFYIEKSNDKDRVDYGMRLDQHCVPLDDRAVFPYWRELQHPPPVRAHPLKFFQYVAYGFTEQRLLSRSKTGGQYRVLLKQVNRPIVIVTGQDAARRCTATAYVRLEGVAAARLDHIFAQVAGAMSVDYIDVHGFDPKTGRALVERMKP